MGKRMERVEEFVNLWWRKWQDCAFELFTPRKKWKKERRALSVGDVVLLKADKKLGPGSFRLAKVTALHPDNDGVTRTVTIAMRSRRRRKESQLEEVQMAIQRLIVILPIEEQRVGEVIDPEI